jgi:hypothetical protein
MKNLIVGSIAAFALLVGGSALAADAGSGSAKAKHHGKVMTKGGHVSKAHVCKDASGNEVKTTEKTKHAKAGATIRREKTCTNEGGTWTPVNADAGAADAGSGSAAAPAKHAKKAHKKAKGS